MSTRPSSNNFPPPPFNIFTSSTPTRDLRASQLSSNTSNTSNTVDGVVILPLNHSTNSHFQQYHGRVYEPQPLPPPPESAPPPLPPRQELDVPRIEGFKSINALQRQHLNGTADAMERLVALKRFINALQRKRESYWRRQGVVTGVGLGLSVVTFGGSIAAGGLLGAYQGDRLDTIKAKIRQAIRQINMIRSVYEEEERWGEAEAMVRIDSDIFTYAIQPHELNGSL